MAGRGMNVKIVFSQLTGKVLPLDGPQFPHFNTCGLDQTVPKEHLSYNIIVCTHL